MRPRGARNHSAVASLLRRDERVHAQSIKLVNCLCRVVASIGGYFPGHDAGVAYGFLNHDHGLLLVRGLVGGPGRHDDLVGVVNHRLTVVRLLEVPATRPRHDAGLSVSEVALGLVVRHPGMLLTFCFDLFRRRLGLGFQRRLGLAHLL